MIGAFRLGRFRFLLSVVSLVASLFVVSYADSPITSTPFSDAYLDLEIVKRAKLSGMMSLEFADFLSNPEAPIDAKAALINALGWRVEGKKNALLYRYYLGIRYRMFLGTLDAEKLQPDELFALGYLKVMDNYFKPEKALPYLRTARRLRKRSLTIALLLALTEAQKAMESDWCRVWQLVKKVKEDSSLDQDMRADARKIIFDYMKLYKDSCK